MTDSQCDQCGAPFTKRVPHQRFCSTQCKNTFHQVGLISGKPVQVRSVRMLKHDRWSIVLHWTDKATPPFRPGDRARLGKDEENS